MDNLNATIFEIKKFAVHDGDGIRTTVFFKGCPLKCIWCHNPEGLKTTKQIAFYEQKCVSCGKCAGVCDCHKIENGIHTIDRKKCTYCGKCIEICPKDALTIYGFEMSVDEVFDVIMQDKAFYDKSGGGVTLSGGECLLQADFCRELLKKCKKAGINTAVDTCGYVDRESILKAVPFTDIFLYDIKAIDEDVHIRCTGKSNKIILYNLELIDSLGKAIEVRMPYIPGINSDQVKKAADYLTTIKNITAVKVLPYHNYAASKYNALGIENTLPEIIPSKEEIEKAEKIFNKNDIKTK